MTTSPHGSVWSPAYIDAQPIPKVPRNLLPWLLKDRREAEEGSTFYNSETKQREHDRQGMVHAERELRRIKNDLAGEKTGSDRSIIWARQAEGMAERVEFWRGKMYLLDKIIEQTQRSQS